MVITSVSATNYRCIKEAVLPITRLTSMVGSNGVGKSAFLRALELFYDPSPSLTNADFFASDPSAELEIAVTYDGLSVGAKALFGKYMVGEQLVIARVFRANNGKVSHRYYGTLPRHTPFRPIRDGLDVKDRGKTARTAYDSLRQRDPYRTLPDWTALGDVPAALASWEDANLTLCVRERDDGQFFGLSEGSPGNFGRFTRFLYIPAVRQAALDASEARGSVLTTLMDLVVHAALTNQENYRRLQARTQHLYQRVIDSAKTSSLDDLSGKLSSALKIYVPDAEITLKWRSLAEIELPLPTADVELVEGGYQASVERSGHGLQRAFIMTMLQQLATTRMSTSTVRDAQGTETLPNLVLAVEEPELYQHPSRQRHLAKTLVRLSRDAETGSANTQVLYATHSPLFVSIDRIDEVRLLRKTTPDPDLPKATTVISTSLDQLADTLWRADGQPTPRYTGAALLPRMKQLMTPWVNEGFFADVVVLVEGEDDRAAILATAQRLDLDIDGGGFTVLPCGGKANLDRPLAAFSALGIPTYVIWDSDKGKADTKPGDNHRLLRLVGRPVVDWPSEVAETFACFEVDLDATMLAEIGSEFYERYLVQCQAEFGIPKRGQALKNPAVIAHLLELAEQDGRQCTTLMNIVRAISNLKS